MIVTTSKPLAKDDLKEIIGALSMDLKRYAVSMNRGSFSVADVFKKEAIARSSELKKQKLTPYLAKILFATEKTLEKEDIDSSENSLMYSTLFQNVASKM